jgi:hypothetical protein
MKDWKEINVFKILIVITLLALVLSICTGCGVTQTTTHNCELMEQGQKCLPDHSCCKK